MDEAAKSRVDRLVAALKAARRCLGEDGEVEPNKLSAALLKAGIAGSYPYCRDLLAKQHRSFGAAKAREIETALGLPRLSLEGAAQWPFRKLTPADWDRVDPALKSELEERLLGWLLMLDDPPPPTLPDQSSGESSDSGPDRRRHNG